MQNKQIVPLFLIISILFSINIVKSNSESNSVKQTNQNGNSITIYTLDSFMANPFYDIAGNFSVFSGIPRTNIIIQRFLNEYDLINAITQGNNPEPDVVVGLDNAMQFYLNVTQYFTPYNSPEISTINSSLFQDLNSNGYLIPYDYNILSFNYKNQFVDSSKYPVLKNLTFDNLLLSPLISKLVIENPDTSTIGLGMLLWTVAYYGDQKTFRFVPGLTGHDWHLFWADSYNKVNISDNLSEAYQIFSDTSYNRPIMVNYVTSPAYDLCQSNSTNIKSIVTTFDGKQYSWYKIEGIGLMKNAPNSANGKEFIDWLLSPNVQSEIPLNNWMFPANFQATIPACFIQSSLDPNNISMLNNYLNPATVRAFLGSWLQEWHQTIGTTKTAGFSSSIYLFATFFVIIGIRKKKIKI